VTTSRKALAALICAVVLAGCGPVGTQKALSFLDTSDGTSDIAMTRAQLAGGQIVVSGPQGYCIDASTLRSSPRGGFAAIASCNILSGGTKGPIVEPVLLTVTVSPASGTPPGLPELATALQTSLLENRELSAVTAGLMATGGANAFQGSDPRHWRGAFLIGDKLIGLALYAPVGSPQVGMQGAAFLNTVSSRIRASSSTSGPIAQQSQPATDPLASRLGRLFGQRDL
jgi:hypothetical protein